jgi:hypothetical protein
MRSTKDIISSILAGIVNELKKVLPLFRESDPLDKTAEQGFAVAIAPEIKQLERLGTEAAKQGCPLTASSKRDSSIGSLEDWGNLMLERLPDPAVGGRYKATFTGTGTAAAGTQYINQDTGFVYILESNVSAAGDGIINSVGNEGESVLNVGDELYAQQNTGLDEIITINEILTYPEDEETTENYRNDVVEAFRITPHGGAKGDYILWAKEVSGVFKAFPYNSVNSAKLYIMMLRTDDNPDGTPTLDMIEAVEEKLVEKDVMASGEIIVESVTARTYAIEIQDLSDDLKKDAAEEALEDYFNAKYPYISGIDNENLRTDRITKAEILKEVYDAVFPASVSDVVITAGGSAVTDEYLPEGTIAKPEVTFV